MLMLKSHAFKARLFTPGASHLWKPLACQIQSEMLGSKLIALQHRRGLHQDLVSGLQVSGSSLFFTSQHAAR